MLCADSDARRSYDLDDYEEQLLAVNGMVQMEGITYLKTNIRLEKPIFFQILKHKGKNGVLVIFTHECKWNIVKKRLSILCLKAYKLGITYL